MDEETWVELAWAKDLLEFGRSTERRKSS